MIVELRLEFHDCYNNYIYEVIEIPVKDNERNLEVLLEDEANEWFFSTAEELFQNQWRGRTLPIDYETAYNEYLNQVKFTYY